MDNATDTTATDPDFTAGARIGATVFNPAHPNQHGAYRYITASNPGGAILLEEGEFLITSYHGYNTIGRFTGRTRNCWNIACPTIEQYDIETFAGEDGAIWGRKAIRFPGTLAIRPENQLAR